MWELSIAVAKGRLQADALALLERAGASLPNEVLSSRRLALEDESGRYGSFW